MRGMGTTGSGRSRKGVRGGKRESFVERVVHGIERRIDESHDRRRAREAELDHDREELWADIKCSWLVFDEGS